MDSFDAWGHLCCTHVEKVWVCAEFECDVLPDSVDFSKKLGLFSLVPFSVEIFIVQRFMLL